MIGRNRPPRAIALLFAAALTITVLVAGTSPLTAQASGVTVTIGKHFYPSPVEVYAGQTVTWVNRDTVNHFVVSDLPGVIPFSGTIAPGKTFTFKFTKVGTWGYHDFYWDSMTGTVIVKEGPAPTATPKPTTKPKATPRPTPKPTAKPATTTTKATPKPTAKATASAASSPSSASSSSPDASSSAVAVGVVGSPDAGGSAGPDSAVPTVSSSNGPGGLGLALVIIIMAGAAFAAGLAVATRRRGPALEPALSSATPSTPVSAAPGVAAAVTAVAPEQVAIPPAPPPPSYQMPGDIDDDAPLQGGRAAEDDPGSGEP